MSGLLQELERKWVAAKLEKATLPATLQETADSVEAAAYLNVTTVLRLKQRQPWKELILA